MVKENGMVMMTEKELDRMEIDKEEMKMSFEKRIELLQQAVTELIHGNKNGCKDVRVSKADFLEMYNKALNIFFDNMEEPNGDELPNDIYGKDFTVHWNGIYCNCGDGAIVSNNLVPGIEGVLDEDPTEY